MKEEIVQITVKVTKEKAEILKTLSTKKHMSMSELVRRFIDKGLNVESYKEDVDFFAGIVRAELTSIYNINDIKQVLDIQTNRLAKMIMKIGKISSGELFLLINMFLKIIDSNDEDRFDEILSKSISNGINYMQKKDFAINTFLEDIENLKNIADKLY